MQAEEDKLSLEEIAELQDVEHVVLAIEDKYGFLVTDEYARDLIAFVDAAPWEITPARTEAIREGILAMHLCEGEFSSDFKAGIAILGEMIGAQAQEDPYPYPYRGTRGDQAGL